MKKSKKIKTVLSTAVMGLCLVAVTSCGKDKEPNDDPSGLVTKYNVTFDSQGGSSVSSQNEIESGSKITAPTAPTRAEYRFLGWYKESACTNEFNFSTDTITATTTLYAKWIETFEVTFNVDGGSSVAKQTIDKGGKVTKPGDPTKAGHRFDGWYKDSTKSTAFNFTSDTITAATTIYAKWVATFDVEYDTQGGSVVTKQVIDAGSKATKPENNPTKDGYMFAGWYEDADCQTEFDFDGKTITVATTIYAKWLVKVSKSINFNTAENAYEASVASEFGYGFLTILNGCSKDGASAKTIDGVSCDRLKSNGSANVNAEGLPTRNAIAFTVANAGQLHLWVAAAGTSERTLYLVNSSGETIKSVTLTDSAMYDYTWDLPAGDTYYLYGSNGFNFYRVDITYGASEGVENGFKIETADQTVTFHQGQAFSTRGLQVYSVDTNEVAEILDESEYEVISSNYQANTPGKYTITVKYKDYDPQTYDVIVYEITSLEAYTYSLSSSVSNNWGNGVMSTLNVKQVFATGSAFNSDGLIVYGIGEYNGKTVEFKLDPSFYEVKSTNYNNAVAGTYVIEVEGFGKTTDYEVNVVSTAINKVGDTYKVKVDAGYKGTIGVVEGDYNMFTSVTTALQFIEAANLSATDKVELYVCNGVYNEKVDINIPNLTLIGESATGTVITFNAANGLASPSGVAYGTDASATFAVRESAVNFTAVNITFESQYNTLAKYNALKAITGNTQAEAVMVQSDNAIFYNCIMTGFQDTLQLQGCGRQYFKNCLIVGATDFIFGTNSSALFEQCEIRTIGNGTTDNGGYITAMKGFNKAANTDVTQWGIIFNNCDFTADEAAPVGKTSIGRPWGTNATVVVMNSRLGKHISTAGFTGADKGQRYVTMSGLAPTAAGISFEEYNNTGAGAISTPVVGMTMLTKAEADALLEDFFKAYTLASNGKTFEFAAWTVSLPTVSQEDLLVLPQVYTVTFNTNNGAANTTKEVVINSKLAKPADPIKTGYIFTGWFTDSECTEEFDFDNDVITSTTTLYAGWEEGTKEYGTVDTTWYFNGTAADASKNEYTCTDNTAYQGATGVFTWKGLSIDATVGKFQCRTQGDVQINAGTTISFNVKAGAVVVITSYPGQASYNVNGAEGTTKQLDVNTVNVTEDGTFTIAAFATSYLYSISVTYPEVTPEYGTVDTAWYFNKTEADESKNEYSLDDNTAYQGATGNFSWKGLTIDATTGKFQCRTAGDAQLNAGTTISFNVKAGAVVVITSYPGQASYNVNGAEGTTKQLDINTVNVTEDGTFTIAAFATSYLYSIVVTYPAE